MKGNLSVQADSLSGAEAAMVFDGYGAMKWNASKSLWMMNVRNLSSKPATAMVSGLEGMLIATVQKSDTESLHDKFIH